MSQTKTIDGMRYEAAGTKRIKDGNAATIKVAEQLSTASLIWLLVKRHKVGLLAIGNVLLVLNWVFPEWTELVKSLVR